MHVVRGDGHTVNSEGVSHIRMDPTTRRRSPLSGVKNEQLRTTTSDSAEEKISGAACEAKFPSNVHESIDLLCFPGYRAHHLLCLCQQNRSQLYLWLHLTKCALRDGGDI